jgi:hypothetical protein
MKPVLTDFKCLHCHAILGKTQGSHLMVGGVVVIKNPTPLTCVLCGHVRVWRCVFRFTQALLTT